MHKGICLSGIHRQGMSLAVELQPVSDHGETDTHINGTVLQMSQTHLNGHMTSDLTTTRDANVQGLDNPTFAMTRENIEPGIPPVNFVDFFPMLLEPAASHNDAPTYAEFSTVLEQVNQWLKSNSRFQAMKFESFIKKLDKPDLEPEQVIHHESSYGVNRYVRGLRLWLAPKLDTSAPVQEIGYLTTLPEPSDGSVNTAEASLSVFRSGVFNISSGVPEYCGMAEVMEKLNKFMKKKPIPGTVLSIETVKVKYEDRAAKCLNSEKMSWVDCGRDDRVYLFAIRIYYIVGKPAFEVIGYHDEVPVCLNNWEPMTNKLRFCPFTTVVQRAKKWLGSQKAIRVVNMQTIDIYSDRGNKGEAKVHADKAGYGEGAGHDTQFARILRIFYIQEPKTDICPYENLELTTRLFIPSRRGTWGKDCESFSKTMQRVICWLQLTKVPVFGIETVLYPFSPETYGTGIKDDQAGMSLIASQGKYYITTVRLYFPCTYEEPNPDLLPKIEEEEGWWACSLS